MDLYETRDMLAVLEQVHIPGDFLLTTFIQDTTSHATATIDIDVVRNGKKMAPFTSPVREAQVITREGFATRSYKLPYIKTKMVSTAQDALKRAAGATIYNGATPQARANAQMGKDLAMMDQMIFRREEWMAAQALQTGKVIVEGEGISYEIDFGMLSTHKPVLTGVDLWSAGTADIQGDLTDWADLVYADSGLTATHAILGRDAARAFLNNASFSDTLDRRRIDRGEILIERLPKGVKYYGYDRESGLDLYGYTEKFFNEGTGLEVDLIDPKSVIVVSNQIRMEQHYGMIQNVETDFIGPRFPSNWVSKDPSALWVAIESAPLVALHQPDGVVCAKVLA